MSKNREPSILSNTLPGALAEAIAEHAIDAARWGFAFVMGIAALAWLVAAGLRDE